MSKLFDHYGSTYKKGDYIFREGDSANYLYMIHEGRVQITKKAGGMEKEINILEEGEFFGEMAIINFKPRSANARAVIDCKLIRMDRESFYNSVKDNNQFAVTVIQYLSDRLRETDEELTALLGKQR
ncbi:MAG: cyclic nucleotide-binding domain-containing protein [bacterium]|nr:cyclic nucleotide-binding domain-containing protein [bacterium]